MPRKTSLYEEDFYRWTQHQAALLRTEKWQDLDYINLGGTGELGEARCLGAGEPAGSDRNASPKVALST